MDHYFYNVLSALTRLQARDKNESENRERARARQQQEEIRKRGVLEQVIADKQHDVTEMCAARTALDQQLEEARAVLASLDRDETVLETSYQQQMERGAELEARNEHRRLEAADPQIPWYMSQYDRLMELPASVIECIFSHLLASDVANSQAVCRQWEASIDLTQVWRSNFHRLHQLELSCAGGDRGMRQELTKLLFANRISDNKDHHDHFLLKIEIQGDSYVISVEASRNPNHTCHGQAHSDGPQSVGKAIIINICAQSPAGLQDELVFCVSAIQRHSERLQASLDKAALLSELDTNEGKKAVLTVQLGQSEQAVKDMETTIQHMTMQLHSDECTKDFLQHHLDEVREELQVQEDGQDTVRVQQESDLDKEKMVWVELQATEQRRNEEIAELRQHKTLLTKEFKQLKHQVTAATKQREAIAVQYKQLKQALGNLKGGK